MSSRCELCRGLAKESQHDVVKASDAALADLGANSRAFGGFARLYADSQCGGRPQRSGVRDGTKRMGTLVSLYPKLGWSFQRPVLFDPRLPDGDLKKRKGIFGVVVFSPKSSNLPEIELVQPTPGFQKPSFLFEGEATSAPCLRTM